MSDRIVSMVILAEDLRSVNFLRRYLKLLGNRINQREVRVKFCPRGSGEQFVRKQYAVEVKEQRWCVAGRIKRAALVVHVDADSGTVEGEHKLLADELKDAGLGKRENNERIAIVVPKRHTETWLHGLCGENVTENQDCKHELRDHDSKIGDAAKALFQLSRPNATTAPANLPALATVIPELRRLET